MAVFPFVEMPEEGLFLRRPQKSKLLSARKQSSGTNDSDAHLDACQVGHALTKPSIRSNPPTAPSPSRNSDPRASGARPPARICRESQGKL